MHRSSDMAEVAAKSKACGFAEKLMNARIGAGYSMEALSVVTGLTTGEINDAEVGREVSIRNVDRLNTAIRKLKRASQ